ncbi:MAG: hypothetical protein UV73_C0002G0148 [Candidatus Gottesmanbacteria bacterium GW2011_GWA2_43_14]|uniref:Uncharacterized protein n=1 Tax=Candidatus Gottesmanbacteria bacterium GW2011_GWA2_43_14 TaxID=1618443 RepID=A0A0G1DL92_9BACT|nr:MAG: hypothetical protein UV73_C0002G0148 [Candidatus Gottesmanbacteria bacterium GW2011_GWA2_43_14]
MSAFSVRLAATIIFAIGMILRFYAAGKYPIWLDEASYYILSGNKVADIISQNHWNVTQPPLYMLLMHFWQILGLSELAVRLPSLCFSAITLMTAYLIGSRLKSRYFGLIVLTVFSFSNYLITLSWQMNVYSLAIMLVLISLYLYFFNLKNMHSAALLISVNILGFLTDYGFIWLIISLILFESYNYLFAYRRQKLFFKESGFKLSVITATVLFISVWLMLVLNKVPAALEMSGWLESDDIFIRAMAVFTGISHSLNPVSVVFILVMALGLIISFTTARNKDNSFLRFMVFAVAGPLIFSYAFSVFFQPILLARNLYAVAVMLFFSMSYALYIKRNVLSPLLLAGYIFFSLTGYDQFSKMGVMKFNWAKASNVIAENIKTNSGTAHFFTDTENQQYNFQPLYFYLKRDLNLNIYGSDRIFLLDDFRDYKKYMTGIDNQIKFWLFDFAGDGDSLHKFARRYRCSGINSYRLDGSTYFLSCRF